MLTKTESLMLKYANILTSREEIGKAMGKEWEKADLKIASTIVTLARKNQLDKIKAKNLVKGMPMEKFIDMPMGSGLKTPFKFRNENVITTKL